MLGGNISQACKVCKIGRTAIYEWRDADPLFAAKLATAIERGIDETEDEAHRRAMLGYDEPIVYQGEIQKVRGKVQTVKRFSDYLLARYLAAKRAAWRVGRTEITGAEGEPLQNNAIIVLPDNGRGPGQPS